MIACCRSTVAVRVRTHTLGTQKATLTACAVNANMSCWKRSDPHTTEDTQISVRCVTNSVREAGGGGCWQDPHLQELAAGAAPADLVMLLHDLRQAATLNDCLSSPFATTARLYRAQPSRWRGAAQCLKVFMDACAHPVPSRRGTFLRATLLIWA